MNGLVEKRLTVRKDKERGKMEEQDLRGLQRERSSRRIERGRTIRKNRSDNKLKEWNGFLSQKEMTIGAAQFHTVERLVLELLIKQR